MNKIIFTRKHIITAVIIGILFIFATVGTWFSVISPKVRETFEARGALERTQKENINLQNKLIEVKKNPSLIESEIVKTVPIISNGIDLPGYFKELEAIDSNLNISIRNITFKQDIVFPSESEREQLRKSEVAFDVVCDSSSDLISFVDQLEHGERFGNIKNVDYRAEVGNDEIANSYSTTIVLEFYYLSIFETGKPIG